MLLVACGRAEGDNGLSVRTTEMRFSPATLNAESGRTLFSVRNTGEVVHTFSLNDLGREVTVQPGRTKRLRVTLPPGTYRYVCRILDHEGLGMRGVLRVRPS